MAKEVVNTFVHRNITAEIVKANGRFSFSVTGTEEFTPTGTKELKNIRYCAYCHGLWKSSQNEAETLARQVIDDKIDGTFTPFVVNYRQPQKSSKMVTEFGSIGGRKYGVIKKVKKDG